MPRSVCSCLALLLLSCFLPPPGAHAHQGLAAGRVALIDTPARIYGFNNNLGYWTSRALDSPIENKLVGPYIGYARSWARLYAYNSNNGQWYVAPFGGQVLGEDVENNTATVWTTTNCYGIATLWNAWASRSLDGRIPKGGGSAGTFGLVWTKTEAHAYNASTGQWTAQTLTGSALGGVVTQGMGIIWTHLAVHAFDPNTSSWSITQLEDPVGISAEAAGHVALVWNHNASQAYSGTLARWSTVEAPSSFEGGSAGTDVAVLWTTGVAYAFDANTATWATVNLQSAGSGKTDGSPPGSCSFVVAPNPAFGDVAIDLPPSGSGWKIGIFDPSGDRIRTLEAASSSGPSRLSWDRRNGEGQEVAAGSYWIHAETQERIEARRIVLMK